MSATPRYAPPELIRGDRVDEHADLYSAGGLSRELAPVFDGPAHGAPEHAGLDARGGVEDGGPMKLRTITFAGVLLTAACAPRGREAAPPVSAREEGEIGRVLDDWHDAADKADLARYFGHLGEDAVFLGTDATERWSKAAFLAYARPHFEKGKAWSFRARRRAVIMGGDVAWFDEDLTTAGLGPARGSGVLARREGRWVIVHYNLTITVPNERFDLAKEAAGAATVLAGEPADPLAKIGWLAGTWVGETPSGEVAEESWLPPGGGMMVGVGRSRKKGEAPFFELIRVVAREGKLVYVAQPRGKAATEFAEVKATGEEAVFEDRGHDWPKRIAYRRIAEGLRVRVEGDPGQPAEEWTMRPAMVARAAKR